jgi:hypothetical protein
MHTIVVFTRRSRHEGVLGAWLADAVGRGEKVLVLRAPGEDASVLNRSLAAAGLDPSGVVGSGQVEMLDLARWRAESGGRAQRLYELYLGQVRRAGRDGFPGVAITRDERALRALVRDDVELIAHERDIHRLVADQGVRALCRYPVRDGGGVLHEILRLHCRDVVDDLWQATVVADRLLVRGEIEASNVDRFDVVVRAAVTAGGRCQMVCVRPEPRLRSNTDSWVLSRDTRWVSRKRRSRVRPGRRSTTCLMRGCSTS